MESQITWKTPQEGLPDEGMVVLTAYVDDEEDGEMEISTAYIHNDKFHYTNSVCDGFHYIMNPQPLFWSYQIEIPNSLNQLIKRQWSS